MSEATNPTRAPIWPNAPHAPWQPSGTPRAPADGLTVTLRPPRVHHANRVARASAAIARRLGLGAEFAADLEVAVPLHDIGKLTIPPWILAKQGPLSQYERSLMQTHALAGASLLRATREPGLELAAQIAESHHEWWDGSGYPYGLTGGEISIAGRIVAVADVFDALIHARPYKPAWPRERALREIVASAGTQFDPGVVDSFLGYARESNPTRRPLAGDRTHPASASYRRARVLAGASSGRA